MKLDAKRSLTILIALLLVALGLRLYHLPQRALWFDEANSLLIAKAPPARIVDAVLDDTHSPFYYLLLHYWQTVAGGEMGGRWLSVLAGVATVAVVWSLGNTLARPAAGLLAALVLTLCPLHVWYSQELRMYALQTLLASLSFLFLLKVLRHDKARLWIGYSVITALSLYAQYVSFFIIIAQAVFVAIYHWRDRRKLVHWLLALIAAFLLFAPWLPGFLAQMRLTMTSGWSEPLQSRRVFGFLSLFSGSLLGDSKPRLLSTLITIAVLVFSAVQLLLRRESRQTASLLLLWFAVPILLLALESLHENRFLPRVLLCTAPALALLLGCAATQADRVLGRVVAVIVTIVFITVNLFALQTYYVLPNAWVKSDLREAAAQLAHEYRAGDVIVHTSEFSYRPFEYYLGEGVAQGVATPPAYLPHLFPVTGDGRLPSATAGFQRIWLVLYPDFAHPGVPEKARAWMDQHHRFLRPLHQSPTIFIGLYERRDAPLIPAMN